MNFNYINEYLFCLKHGSIRTEQDWSIIPF